MGDDLNPYVAPKTDVNDGLGNPSPQNTYWRSGALLMARNGAVLPPRCVKCNAEAAAPMKKQRFYWHHPAWFAFVLINVFVYLIVALIVRRSCYVSYGLCQIHKQKRIRGILIGLGGVVLAALLTAAAVMASRAELVLVAILLFVGSLVVSVVLGRTLMPVRIDRSAAQLKGCGEAFLATLPRS